MILAVFCTAALSILFFFVLFRMDALRSLIGRILNILMPFIYGTGIAYVLKPLCNTYERFLSKHWHPKRQKLIGTVSVIGSIVTGLVIIYAVLAMLLPQLALSVARIARSLPEMIESISHMVDHLFEGNEVIQNYIMQLSDAGTESLSGWLKESILPYMNMILTGLSDSMINVAGIFMNLFIGLVVAIYLLYGRRKFRKQGKLLLYSLFKERWADKIVEEICFADRVFSGFIGGKLLDSAIIGGICYTFGCRLIQDQLCRIAYHEVLLVNTKLSSGVIAVIRIQEQSQVVKKIFFVKRDSLSYNALICNINIKETKLDSLILISCHINIIQCGF